MKKLFLGLAISTCLMGSIAFGSVNQYQAVRAEEEIAEPIEEEPVVEEPIEEEKEDLLSEISQTAKDIIAVAKEVLNQPIVIGGVSVTLGALVIFIFTKLIGSLNKKKLSELKGKLEILADSIKDNVKVKDYNALVEDYNKLIALNKELVSSVKNIKIKENCVALLEEIKPIVIDNKEFVEKEIKVVVEDSKKQLSKSEKDILELLQK